MSDLVIKHATYSQRRARNRDFCVVERTQGVYVAVGSVSGRPIVLPTAISAFRTHVTGRVEVPAERIAGALVAVNQALASLEGRDDSEFNWDPDAASIIGAALDGSVAVIAWVGNARAYHLRRSEILAVTAEHSLLTEARATGHSLTRAQEQEYLRLNVTTRVLGLALETPEVSTATWRMRPGERLLLCSRGVYQALGDDEIATLSTGRGGVRRLVRTAARRTERAATGLLARMRHQPSLPRAIARERR